MAPKPPAPAVRVPLERARAFWVGRQGLGTPREGPLPAVVAGTGWLRTLGGADAYLALRARVPGLTRAAVDGESERFGLRVLPSVRNCIYLVPAAHAPLALRVAETAWRPRTEREVVKAGATWREVDDAAAAALDVLASPMTTDGLRRALPPGTVRGLGDAGKKVGLSSVLPVALRLLELSGRLERSLEGGRLDTDRYLWRRSSPGGEATARTAADPAKAAAELLRLFLSWSAPASLKEFAAWSGLSLGEAKAAAAGLDLATVAVEGRPGDDLVPAGDVTALLEAPEPAGVRLLSFEDNLLTSHGGPAVHVAPEDRGRPVESWGTAKATTLGEAAHVSRRTILARGTVAGYWELDVEARKVVTGLFRPLPPRETEELAGLASGTARFLLEEVGHARSFGLDTDENVRKRARATAET